MSTNGNDRRRKLLDLLVTSDYEGLADFAREEALILIAHVTVAVCDDKPDWHDVHDTARRIMVATGAMIEFGDWRDRGGL